MVLSLLRLLSNMVSNKFLVRIFSRKDEIRFQEFANTYQPGKGSLYPSLDTYDRRQWVNAFIQVQDFRDKNPKITAKWKEHDRNLKQCAAEGWDFTIDIPGRRTLKYFRCRNESDGVTVATQKGALRRVKMYGANLFQNTVQGCARDCFAHILTN